MSAESMSMKPTETNRCLPLKNQGFDNLVEALEYAAEGETGYNFYNGRGELYAVLSYRELRDEAQVLARRLLGLGCERGARVGIVAETHPMFHRFFYACQYAGFIPVSLPSSVQIGAHKAYVEQLRRMLETCGADIAVSPESHATFLQEATVGMSLKMAGVPEDFDALPESDAELRPMTADEPAYLQYTSGSTRFPRGVEITQKAALKNLSEIALEGLKIGREDRMVSWLPLYHDMGLVGFMLVPLASQLSTDYLSPRSFAMRPRLWLKVLSENRGTISSSPPFGYALCAKRLRWADCQAYDLSAWRVACVGAERINPEPLERFAEVLKPTGFSPDAWVACYGMAECTLAISFAPLRAGLEIDIVDKELMAERGEARPLPASERGTRNSLCFVDCGEFLPSYSYSIRDDAGDPLPDRRCGRIWVKGPSVMTGYFEDPESTAEVMTSDGWLDTGDIGYCVGSRVFVTARSKDVIIIKGRNIWPQDLEHLAEQIPGVRYGHVSAFAAPTRAGEELAVLVAESREKNPAKCRQIIEEMKAAVQIHFGINSYIDLVPSGTLPRTSSGKLSRSQTKRDFLARESWDAAQEGDRFASAEANG